MNTRFYRLSVTIFILGIVAGLLFVASPVNSAPGLPPIAQRPTVDPGGGDGGNGGTGVGGNGAGGSTEAKCASVAGQVINWGFGGEGGVTTALKDGSWQVSTISASDGNYGFGGLGIGIAVLHVALTPAQAGQFQPLIQDAGVYLNCDYLTVANIALYGGPRITPPAMIEMSALHQVLTPGGGTEITLTIKNSLPNDTTNVVVTDLIPAGLIALDVSSSIEAKNLDIINGPDRQLVAVNLDRMAAGATATIRITVITAADVPRNTQISNTATLFYQESVADQTSLDFTIGDEQIPVEPLIATVAIPATPLPPAAGATPITTPEPALTTIPTPATPLPTSTVESEGGEEFVPPDGLPTTGDDFVPPGFLPITGKDAQQIPNTLPHTGLGFIIPVGGLGLAILAFLVHHLRTSNRNRQ